MEIQGEVVAQGNVENTYRALTDPEWLAVTMPGVRECERLDEAPGIVAARIVWELGLSMMRVRFTGRVGWTLEAPPHQLGLAIAGSGTFGELDLTLAVTLSAEGTSTRIFYRGHGEGPEESTSTWKTKALEPVAHLMVQKLVEALAEGANRPGS